MQHGAARQLPRIVLALLRQVQDAPGCPAASASSQARACQYVRTSPRRRRVPGLVNLAAVKCQHVAILLLYLGRDRIAALT
jgi:hypothetical protein